MIFNFKTVLVISFKGIYILLVNFLNVANTNINRRECRGLFNIKSLLLKLFLKKKLVVWWSTSFLIIGNVKCTKISHLTQCLWENWNCRMLKAKKKTKNLYFKQFQVPIVKYFLFSSAESALFPLCFCRIAKTIATCSRLLKTKTG